MKMNNIAMLRLLLEYSPTHDLGMKCRSSRLGRTALLMACDMGLVDDVAKMIGWCSSVSPS